MKNMIKTYQYRVQRNPDRVFRRYRVIWSRPGADIHEFGRHFWTLWGATCFVRRVQKRTFALLDVENWEDVQLTDGLRPGMLYRMTTTPTEDKPMKRTLGSLSGLHIGSTLKIKQSGITFTGVLGEVRHHLGGTSGRPVTTIRLVDPETLESSHNHHGTGERGYKVSMPDDSNTMVEVY